MSLPLLPTGVVGSYSMPGWLERLKTEYIMRRISRLELDEVHDTAVKAAIKDQEVAGVDFQFQVVPLATVSGVVTATTANHRRTMV